MLPVNNINNTFLNNNQEKQPIKTEPVDTLATNKALEILGRASILGIAATPNLNITPVNSSVASFSASTGGSVCASGQAAAQSTRNRISFEEIENEAVGLLQSYSYRDLKGTQLEEVNNKARLLESQLEEEWPRSPNNEALRSLLQKIYSFNTPADLKKDCILKKLFTNIFDSIFFSDYGNKYGKVALERVQAAANTRILNNKNESNLLENLLSKDLNYSPYEIKLILDSANVSNLTFSFDTPSAQMKVKLSDLFLRFLHNNFQGFQEDEKERFLLDNVELRVHFHEIGKAKAVYRTSRRNITGLYLTLFSYNNLFLLNQLSDSTLKKFANSISKLVWREEENGNEDFLIPLIRYFEEKGLSFKRRYVPFTDFDLTSTNLKIHNYSFYSQFFSGKSLSFRFELAPGQGECINYVPQAMHSVYDFDFLAKFEIMESYKTSLKVSLGEEEALKFDSYYLSYPLIFFSLDAQSQYSIENPNNLIFEVRADVQEYMESLFKKGQKSSHFYNHTLILLALLSEKSGFSNRLVLTYLSMLRDELSKSRVSFEKWLAAEFTALIFHNDTKKGSRSAETYTWLKIIETFLNRQETAPYNYYLNNYDITLIKNLLEEATGQAIIGSDHRSLEFARGLPEGSQETVHSEGTFSPMPITAEQTNDRPMLPSIEKERVLPCNPAAIQQDGFIETIIHSKPPVPTAELRFNDIIMKTVHSPASEPADQEDDLSDISIEPVIGDKFSTSRYDDSDTDEEAASLLATPKEFMIDDPGAYFSDREVATDVFQNDQRPNGFLKSFLSKLLQNEGILAENQAKKKKKRKLEDLEKEANELKRSHEMQAKWRESLINDISPRFQEERPAVMNRIDTVLGVKQIADEAELSDIRDIASAVSGPENGLKPVSIFVNKRAERGAFPQPQAPSTISPFVRNFKKR